MNKVALEVAQQEFERFIEDMDIDADQSVMDEEDKTAFNKHKSRMIKNIIRGSLVINENGEAVYTPHREASKHKDAITFHERTGASLMAADGKKKGDDVKKTYAVMGNMCKLHPGVFAGLSGPDIKACESIFALLMD